MELPEEGALWPSLFALEVEEPWNDIIRARTGRVVVSNSAPCALFTGSFLRTEIMAGFIHHCIFSA